MAWITKHQAWTILHMAWIIWIFTLRCDSYGTQYESSHKPHKLRSTKHISCFIWYEIWILHSEACFLRYVAWFLKYLIGNLELKLAIILYKAWNMNFAFWGMIPAARNNDCYNIRHQSCSTRYIPYFIRYEAWMLYSEVYFLRYATWCLKHIAWSGMKYETYILRYASCST